LANGGKKFHFADGDGEIVFVLFEAEGASHAAAAGAGLWKSTPRRRRTDSSAVIFMRDLWWQVTVEDRFAVDKRQRKVRSVGFEELAEQESLAR